MRALLEQYNPHWKDSRYRANLIDRPLYLQKTEVLLNRREILVVMGIRRAGKSSLLKLMINDLLSKDVSAANLLYINLEDYRLGEERNIKLLDDLFQTYRNLLEPKGRVYAFLDEIQEIERFERWLRTEFENNPNIKFIISGSSSSLLSGELATLLTGRQVSIEIFPFSFLEYLEYALPKSIKTMQSHTIDQLYLSSVFTEVEPILTTYLRQGGFPEIVKHHNEQGNIMLLQQYFDDILFKDIIKRYNVRKKDTLHKFAQYLISNIANEINISRLTKLLGSNRTTMLEMLNYFLDVYLVFTTSNFSFSLNERLNTTKPKKVFCVDNGFFTALKQTQTIDMGKIVENAVFQQLRFNWHEEIFHWRSKTEVDFVLGNGFPLNVTIDDQIREREVTSLLYFMGQHNLNEGILISYNKLDYVEENSHRILILPLWLFLTKPKETTLAQIGKGVMKRR